MCLQGEISVLDATWGSVPCLTSETWIPTSCDAAQWEEWFNNPISILGCINIHSRPDFSLRSPAGGTQRSQKRCGCALLGLMCFFNRSYVNTSAIFKPAHRFSGSDGFFLVLDNLLFSPVTVGGSERFGWGEQQCEDLSDLPVRKLFQPVAAQRLHPKTKRLSGLRGAAFHHDGVFIPEHAPPQL